MASFSVCASRSGGGGGRTSSSISRKAFAINYRAFLVLLAFVMDTWLTLFAHANQTTLDLPPLISSCLTPMNVSTALRWQKELSYGRPLDDVPLFCEEAGLICDQNIETPYLILHRLSRYRLSKFKETSIHNDQRLFFKESELSLGNMMSLPMEEPHIPTRAFLHPLLEPLLFNSSQSLLQDVLHSFGFEYGSPLAKSMNESIEICNFSPMEGETKVCIATFEDMFDFATSLIGSLDVSILATNILPSQELVKVINLQEMTNEGQCVSVACHNAMFPFQVFYCHHIKGTKVFNVTLQTITRTDTIVGIASCHPFMEDSHEEIEHIMHMKIKENELLCHWNHGDNIVWVPQSKIISQSSTHPIGELTRFPLTS